METIKTYKIEFLTLDGNINSVFLYAENEQKAIYLFEKSYQHEAIRKVTDLD